MNQKQKLKTEVANQVKRIKKAEQDRPNLLSQTVYISTLGLVIVLPIIGGAYLGYWLDSLAVGYSSRWTLSLLLLGVVIGGTNLYFLISSK